MSAGYDSVEPVNTAVISKSYLPPSSPSINRLMTSLSSAKLVASWWRTMREGYVPLPYVVVTGGRDSSWPSSFALSKSPAWQSCHSGICPYASQCFWKRNIKNPDKQPDFGHVYPSIHHGHTHRANRNQIADLLRFRLALHHIARWFSGYSAA